MIKQVLILRIKYKNNKNEYFQIRKGKQFSQLCHASCAFLTKIIKNKLDLTKVQEKWINDKFTKICLQVDTEEELLEVHKKALEAGLDSYLIQDAGLTEFDSIPTYTCVGIGPDESEKIDKITGHLKLY